MTATIEDQYAELKQASPEELLAAAIQFYKVFSPVAESYIRMGFALAGPDGWRQVAPAWLKRKLSKANSETYNRV